MFNSIVNMHVGLAGSGKSHLAYTFPKFYCISTEPNNHWVWELNPELKKNMVKHEYFIPEKNTLKDMFVQIEDKINEAKELHVKGEVDTLILDNLTYLVHNRWMWIKLYAKKLTRTGEVDTRGMYGDLRSWGYDFLLMNILSFKGNVVVNVHEMQENDEALDKKIDKSITIVPNITGGLRNDVDGLFSNVFYLSKINRKEGGYRYMCRTNKGSSKNAKNRFNLDEVLEDVSYQVIRDAINKTTNKKGEK